MGNVTTGDSSGSTTTSTSTKSGGYEYGSKEWFAAQVLRGIGAPTTAGNMEAMLSWMAAEGGNWNNSARYNPLNTTLDYHNSGDTGTQGNISVYNSWEDGVAATVKTLQLGYYTDVVTAFQNDQPKKALNAVEESPWGTKSISYGSGSDYASSGGGGGGGATAGTGGGTNVHLSEKDIAANYGFSAEFLDEHGAIDRLIHQAVEQGWSDARFQHELYQTPWYRKHSDAEREWQLLKLNDPGEVEDRVRDRIGDINTLSRQMGVRLSDAAVEEMANKSLAHGWDDAKLQKAIGKQFEYDPDASYKGVAGQTIDQLNEMASAYLVPISDQRMEQWTTQVLKGNQTVAGFEDYIKNQAKSLYPYMADFLDSGGTVAQYADPYVQMAANELGISPGQVDLLKPMWSKPLTYRDESGKVTGMSLSDWQVSLRTQSQYGFDSSANAKQQAASFAAGLAQQFGQIG